MKVIFLSDMHGENPAPLIKRELKENGIEKAVFLGDYDTPEVLRELRKLRLRKFFVVGNHDYHYMLGYGIGSELMTMSPEGYAELWKKNPKERDFILKAIKKRTRNSGIILEDKLSRRKVVYTHAAIVDDGESPDKDVPDYVWQRFEAQPIALISNFLKMEEKGYWIMFRGHDHQSIVTSFSIDKRIHYSIENRSGSRLKLSKDKKHMVDIGAFYYGDYAVFDERTGYLEFKNTGTGNVPRGL